MTQDDKAKPGSDSASEEYEVEIVDTELPTSETQNIKKEGDPVGDNFA
ncbi:MAG: hypothetical protein OSB00_14920 [Sphingomonas bacterium]|nr:hypothetical protein [Sphingomonas bacterium]